MTPLDVKIFRHDFVTMFRFSEAKTIHPNDIHIIASVGDTQKRYEEETGTVFVTRDLVQAMSRMMQQSMMANLQQTRRASQPASRWRR